jgi:hypothetical protein
VAELVVRRPQDGYWDKDDVITIDSVEVRTVPYWFNLDLGVWFRLVEILDNDGVFQMMMPSRLDSRRRGKDTQSRKMAGGRGSLDLSSSPEPIKFRTPSPEQDKRTSSALICRNVLGPLAGPHWSRDKGRDVVHINRMSIDQCKMVFFVRMPDYSIPLAQTGQLPFLLHLPLDNPSVALFIPAHTDTNLRTTVPGFFQKLHKRYISTAKQETIQTAGASYIGLLCFGIANAIVYLFRFPSEGIVNSRGLSKHDRFVVFVYALRDGTYMCFTEFVGTMFFTMHFFCNILYRLGMFGRHLPRASGIVDGFKKGIVGLVVDSFRTLFFHVFSGTRAVYHEYGCLVAIVVIIVFLIRIPLGPVFGLLHFFGCVFEGCGNALKDEPSQYMQVRPQMRLDVRRPNA